MTNSHTTKSPETLFRKEGQRAEPSSNDIQTNAESMPVFEDAPSGFSKNASRYTFQSFKRAVRPSLFADPLETVTSKPLLPRNVFAKASFSKNFDNKRFDWVSQQSQNAITPAHENSNTPLIKKQVVKNPSKSNWTTLLNQLQQSDWLILEDIPDNPLDTIFENNGYKTRLFYHQHTQQLCLLTRTVSQWGIIAPCESDNTSWFESSCANAIEDFDATALASNTSDTTVLWTLYLISPRLADTASSLSTPYTQQAVKAESALSDDVQARCQVMFEGKYHQNLSASGFMNYYQSLPVSLTLNNANEETLWLQHKAALLFEAFGHREECFKPLKQNFFNLLAQPLSTQHLHETLMWVQLSKTLVESRLIHLASERAHLDHLLKQLAEQFQLLSQTCSNGTTLGNRVDEAQTRFKALMTDGLWRVQLHTQPEFIR